MTRHEALYYCSPEVSHILRDSSYQCEATSITGFIQQLVCYFSAGYVLYSTARIPTRKMERAQQIDEKMLRNYDINLTDWQRQKQSRTGQAVLQYLRFEAFHVTLATKGWGLENFFAEEQVKNAFESPLSFAGYSLKATRKENGKIGARVRIEEKQYRLLKEQFEKCAVQSSVDELAAAFRSLPFEPYHAVKTQLFSIWKAVNTLRKTANQELIPQSCLRKKIRRVKPFAPASVSVRKAA